MLLRFFFLLLCLHSLCFAKPPSLTPKDTRVKIEEILKSHVSYQQLTEEVIQRAFINYLEEIDPLKTYLLEDEVDKWINPSTELLISTLSNIKNEDFTIFFDLHQNFLQSIPRRHSLEETVTGLDLPTSVEPSEFKNLAWTQNTSQLKDRLLRIKSLQTDSASKLSPEEKDQFFQKLTKRRLTKESELAGKSEEERKQITLSYVLKSISSALDSQTAYFTPSEANSFMMQVQQKLYGIGAQLRDDLNGLTIIRLIEGGPAATGGKLKIGDKIIAVNNETIIGFDIAEAVDLIRGRQGTTVQLTVLRSNDALPEKEEKLEIDIVRDEIVLKETRLHSFSHPFGDGVIGVFHLFSFYEDKKNSSSIDLYQAIDELKKTNNLKGVVLDLRNNAGGLLSQAVAVTSLFISKGIVVSVKSNSGTVEHLRNLENKKIWDGPLLVLTNKASASASEIVAQTLQDYGRALVVGDAQTFGKGTFQTFTLESANYGKVNPKGEFKVTRGRYYTVSGKSPQLVGVQADITIPGVLSELEIGEKYAKFPLSSDEIPSNFQDDLLDISPLLRSHVTRLYKRDKQLPLSHNLIYLDRLKSNSKQRIENNKDYQKFLSNITNTDNIGEVADLVEHNDLQFNEALNVMMDFIYLQNQDPLQAIAQ